MNPKILIAVAIVGILALTAFNLMLSRHATTETVTPTNIVATNPPPATNTPLGLQPKATMDRAVGQINQANADTTAKLDQADGAK